MSVCARTRVSVPGSTTLFTAELKFSTPPSACQLPVWCPPALGQAVPTFYGRTAIALSAVCRVSRGLHHFGPRRCLPQRVDRSAPGIRVRGPNEPFEQRRRRLTVNSGKPRRPLLNRQVQARHRTHIVGRDVLQYSEECLVVDTWHQIIFDRYRYRTGASRSSGRSDHS